MDSLAQSLHAGAIAPEAAILIALLACLLADLAGEKAASRFVPPFCYAGLGTSLVLLPAQRKNAANSEREIFYQLEYHIFIKCILFEKQI